MPKSIARPHNDFHWLALSSKSKMVLVKQAKPGTTYPELEKILEDKDSKGKDEPMKVSFRKVDPFDLWVSLNPTTHAACIAACKDPSVKNKSLSQPAGPSKSMHRSVQQPRQLCAYRCDFVMCSCGLNTTSRSQRTTRTFWKLCWSPGSAWAAWEASTA